VFENSSVAEAKEEEKKRSSSARRRCRDQEAWAAHAHIVYLASLMYS